LLFGVAPLLNHVVMSQVRPDGSSVQTHDVGLAVSSQDPWFRPVDIKLGPDGALYIADWYDRQIAHFRNYQGQIDPGNGRIYRLKAQNGGGVTRSRDFSRLSTSELATLLSDPNKWTRQTALRLIGDRKDSSIVPKLLQLLKEETGQTALEALWALNLVAGIDEATALDALDHADPYVRLWTVRLQCDAMRVSPSMAAALASRGSVELNIEVLSQLACSAKRLPARDALPIVRALLARSEIADDIHIPLLLWWALESKIATDADLVLKLFEDRATWNLATVRKTVAERLMRRFAASGSRRDLATCARLLAMAPGTEHIKRLMAGFEAASAGRSLTGLPPELAQALATYSGQSVTLALRQGQSKALAEAMHVLTDDRADRTKQLLFLQILGEVRQPACVPVVLRLACQSSDNALRTAALGTLAAYDDPAIGTEVIKACANMSDDVLASAQSLLVSRRKWAAQFLAAIEAKTIDPRTVRREDVEKLLLLGDADITAVATKLFGPIKPATSADLRGRIDRLAGVIHAGSGVPKPGRQIFDQQCARCHTLFSAGGKVGPDLTTYRRDDLENILLNIVNPSAEIREGYTTSIVAMTDGRILSGIVVEEDKNVVVLRGGDGKEAALARADIDAIRPTRTSIMPEGLLNELSDQQVRDLFAYLRSTQPLID
jgi:putative heme-binding domain-containing protein